MKKENPTTPVKRGKGRPRTSTKVPVTFLVEKDQLRHIKALEQLLSISRSQLIVNAVSFYIAENYKELSTY